MRNTLSLVVTTIIFAACGPKVTYTPLAPPAPPRGLAANVDIYDTNDRLPDNVKVLGEVSVGDTGLSTDCGLNRALSTIRDKAREVGADAAYIVQVSEPGLMSSCYRITARLLQYEERRAVPAVAVETGGPWTRTPPQPGEIITLTSADVAPAPDGSPYQRAARATIQVTTSSSAGAGFLISRGGLALTNHHVIEGSSQLTATLPDGTAVRARVLRSDPVADVALIEIQCAAECTTVSVAGDVPDPATEVLAIGNPSGLTRTVTRGVVGGLRFIDGVTQIQIDASINSGNSGGPLVNARDGSALGIVTWKLVGENREGLGFAVAIQDALRVLGVRVR